MDIFQNLIHEFSVSLSITNLGYCFLGVLLGTLVGVLPGLGSSTAMALLLPVTFYCKDISGIIMLQGYGMAPPMEDQQQAFSCGFLARALL